MRVKLPNIKHAPYNTRASQTTVTLIVTLEPEHYIRRDGVIMQAIAGTLIIMGLPYESPSSKGVGDGRMGDCIMGGAGQATEGGTGSGTAPHGTNGPQGGHASNGRATSPRGAPPGEAGPGPPRGRQHQKEIARPPAPPALIQEALAPSRYFFRFPEQTRERGVDI